VEPLFKQRGEIRSLIEAPPPGYRFVADETALENTLKTLSGTRIAYQAHWALMRLLPVNLVKPVWERFKKLPSGVDLTYAVAHPVFRREAWIMDMRLEQPYLLIGHEAVFHRWKWLLKSALTSPRCRRILFELDAGRKAFLQMTGWSDLEPKMAVVHSAVPRRSVARPIQKGKGSTVRLLFVNSANITIDDHFYAHGGLLAVETFFQLRQRFPNLELVVRSSIPAHLKRKWGGVPNLRLIDRVLPWHELEREFVAADIFIYPTHVTPSMVLLDAMSYELPIVTTDVWGNPELVKHGHNGFLIHHPEAWEYTDGFVVHFGSQSWRRAIGSVDQRLMQGMVQKTSSLIEDLEFRRRMGRQGRREVEEGEFSIRRRNETLKRVLDDAIAGCTGGP
jgi:glycosyltransferase involved in cell wall biosynthesis